MSATETFSLHHTMQPGTVLVEASAGTGKTYSIAGLYVRMIYEQGLSAEGILVVTFTNAATAELKTRIRQRLQDAIAVTRARQEDPEAYAKTDIPPPGRDPQLLRRDLQRLRRALESFDRAAIHTIHGFCKRLLETFPFESEAEGTVEYGLRPKSMVRDLAQDLYTTKTYGLTTELLQVLENDCGYSFEALVKIANTIANNQDADLYPCNAGSLHPLHAKLTELRAAWADEWPEISGTIEDFFETEHGEETFSRLNQRKYQKKRVEGWRAKLEKVGQKRDFHSSV